MTTAARLSELDALVEQLTVDAYGDQEQLSGVLVGAENALRRGEPARVVGMQVQITAVDQGPDARTGLTARVQSDGATYEVALADLPFSAGSRLGLIVAAYRRWQGRTP
jgi:hypothetical protein